MSDPLCVGASRGEPEGSRFQRLRALFERLSEVPELERAAEIERAGLEPDLAEELRALLAAAARSGTALDAAALALADSGDSLPSIPGFRIVRRIGRGGSATVYLAEQEGAGFRRQVALKVVDRIVDAESLRRVREEQRILARLEHPGIARLYDAGVTPSGQPYLAMELVEGASILEHCRAGDLQIRERIELFLAVLGAVGFAHGEAVVHRDLKPANILVSARGEAKLLDFGIAKLVAAPGADQETRTVQRALTPAYASPEQLRGDRVGPASDIYSLGVVLYELLADTLPYRLDGKRIETVEDAIREQDPEPPSAAFARSAGATTATAPVRGRVEVSRRRRTLRGDLDAVLLKALRKEPRSRYASATALADDLRRFLAGQPVAARRGGWRYRAGKWLRRQRGGLATTATAAALVLALAAIPQTRKWWLGERAVRTESEFAVYHAARPADRETRRLLHQGADLLSRHDAAAARASFLEATERTPAEALAWDGLARAEGALGETGRAAAAARRAAAAATALEGDETERLRARALAADRKWERAIPALEGLFGRQPSRVDIGLDLVAALAAAGRSDEAEVALGRLRQLHSAFATVEEDPRIDLAEAEVALRLSESQRAAAAAERARAQAQALGAVALGLRAERLHAEAIVRLDRREEARAALESLVARDLAAGLECEAALARLAIGGVLLRTAGNEEARAVLDLALASLRARGERRGETLALVQLGLLAGKRGEFDDGFRFFDQALAASREIGDRWSEGVVLSQRMVLLNWADDTAGVAATVEPALAALRDSGNRQTLLTTLCNLAIAGIESLELEQATRYLDEAEALGPRVGSQLASSRVTRARAYLQQTRGDLELARQSYGAGLETARRSGVSMEIGHYHAFLAWLELDAGRPDQAAVHAHQAIAAFGTSGDPRLAADVEPVLAWVEARRGDGAAARRRLAALRKASDAGSGSSDFVLLTAEARVAEELGEWRRAIELRRRAIAMATEWEAAGLVMDQRLGLARALHGNGDRGELEKLVAELLPEAERKGLRGVERDLRALLATRGRAGTL